MISAIFTFIFLVGFSAWYGQLLHKRNPGTKASIFNYLILFHIFMTAVYFTYAAFNRSDSIFYYSKVYNFLRGSDWFSYYGVSTTFIEFVGYPLIHFLGLSFPAVMMVFSWFGLMGIFHFYLVLNERLKYRHTFFGYDLLYIILFLPNMHFWAASFGKGSIILLGFGLYFYALNDPGRRIISGIIGALIIYHVRPHILFVVLGASVWGFMLSSRGVSTALRLSVVVLTVIGFYFIKEDVLAITGIDEETIFEDTTTLDKRAAGLSRATSGVDLSNYSFGMKLFTFWFRPMFIDAPNALGLIVSFENLFYILIFLKLFKSGFLSFFRGADHVVKASVFTFLGVSAALAQICANLGIAMRQKSQVMILMMFVILKFMDETKQRRDELEEQRKKIRDRRKPLVAPKQGGRVPVVKPVLTS
jgi:hypothetical protein